MRFFTRAGVAILALASLAACAGYATGPDYDGSVVVEPDYGFWGWWGGDWRGRDHDHDRHPDYRYGSRGAESRGASRPAAAPAPARAAAPAVIVPAGGGGGGHGRRQPL